MRLNLLLGDNPTAILSCAAKAALRVFVARTTRAQYEAVIKNGINYTALYIRALCSLTVVDLYVSTWKQAKYCSVKTESNCRTIYEILVKAKQDKN